MTTSESNDFFPDDPFPTAPEEPGGYKEWVDREPDPDLRQKIINAATSHAQEAVWQKRRIDFLRDLDRKEARWFPPT